MTKHIDYQQVVDPGYREPAMSTGGQRCAGVAQQTDSDLAALRASAEFKARFEAEVQPYFDTLLRGARRMTFNASDAEDLVQDTLMHAYVGFRTFQPGTNIQAWLFRILRNQSINAYRTKQRRPEELLAEDFTDQMLAAEGAHSSSAPRSAETEVLQALPDSDVTAALLQLPEGLRATVFYADVEGLSYREIAAILHIPVGTVMSRLHRGRNRLRDLLFDVMQDRGLYRAQLSMCKPAIS
jgi:RNA polymerase sigma-70 factor, ECF subfamily